jgi:hypothetical protein
MEDLPSDNSFDITIEKMLPAILEMQIKTLSYLQFLFQHVGLDISDVNQSIAMEEMLKAESERLYAKYGTPPSDIIDLLNEPL